MKPKPTKEPKPITDFPEAGQLRVVISFRQGRGTQALSYWHRYWEEVMRRYEAYGLDVAVSVIGAGGERSEMEVWP